MRHSSTHCSRNSCSLQQLCPSARESQTADYAGTLLSRCSPATASQRRPQTLCHAATCNRKLRPGGLPRRSNQRLQPQPSRTYSTCAPSIHPTPLHRRRRRCCCERRCDRCCRCCCCGCHRGSCCGSYCRGGFLQLLGGGGGGHLQGSPHNADDDGPKEGHASDCGVSARRGEVQDGTSEFTGTGVT